MKLKKYTFPLLAASTLTLGVGFVAFSGFQTKEKTKTTEVTKAVAEPAPPTIEYGLAIDSFLVETGSVARNEFLSLILERYGINSVEMAEVVKKSKPVFDVRKISTGHPFTVYSTRENPERAAYFIYEPNAIDYIVYDLRDSVQVYAGKHDVETRVESVSGEIANSLYEALQNNGASPDLAIQLADIYGSTVDFYRIKEGDWFKVQYERQYVKDKPVGQGRIQSALFSHKGETFQSFYFEPEEGKGGYYDEDGNSLKRAFLKAPLKFSRISSRYSKRRLHPVQKVWKAHLGTDYAAPSGTPIIATANGVVVESGFTRGNGNYVKVKHDATYTTQYLHMSRRAAKVGQRITQGQVIGYVGSTGLATGPHVCYRFWKNGQQVDPLRQKINHSIPLGKEHMTAFNSVVIEKQAELSSIRMPHEIILASNEDPNQSVFDDQHKM